MWDNPCLPGPIDPALTPWVSPGRVNLAPDPTESEAALWAHAACGATPELQFPRKLWPDWTDVLNALIAIEWRRAGMGVPEDPFADLEEV
ncbi:hypothetical protein [Nocardia sp. NPDC050793]|uniref:hypothetical protein n=1 Tax=Nocardia sp. NPDC050793 TaxID=3155159 RepID=UPI0033CC9778